MKMNDFLSSYTGKKVFITGHTGFKGSWLAFLLKELGANKSWAVRLAYNKNFGGVMIQQLPGEGNRIHKHPKNDECWVILKGQWKWIIEGKDEMEVSVGSVINVPANTFHQIKCIGSEPGIRYAITAPDVEHVYKE